MSNEELRDRILRIPLLPGELFRLSFTPKPGKSETAHYTRDGQVFCVHSLVTYGDQKELASLYFDALSFGGDERTNALVQPLSAHFLTPAGFPVVLSLPSCREMTFVVRNASEGPAWMMVVARGEAIVGSIINPHPHLQRPRD